MVTTIGQARSRGLEGDVRGRFTRHLSGIASYAYTDAIITKDPTYQGQRLPEVPRNSGSLLLHDTIGENWTAGAGLFAQGLRNGDYGSDFALPGYVGLTPCCLAGSDRSLAQYHSVKRVESHRQTILPGKSSYRGGLDTGWLGKNLSNNATSELLGSKRALVSKLAQ